MSDLERSLSEDLTIIALLWGQLTHLPRAPGGDKVDTSNTAPTPLSVGVLSMRFDAAHDLASWAQLVWRERDLHEPLDLTDVRAVCAFLVTHANWLTHHPAGKDAGQEIGVIAGTILEMIRQTKPHRFVVGPCPDCDGKLVAYLRNSDAYLPSELRCNADPLHVWAPSQWRFLGNRIHGVVRYEVAARRLANALGM